jgi:hypothetical protein
MRVRARQLATVAALATTLAVAPAVPAFAVDVQGSVKQHGGLKPYAIFVVKDLGGGAYWLSTTSALYAVDAGSAALISAATTGADLMVQVAENGRDLLLLVNGAVLVPVQDAVS